MRGKGVGSLGVLRREVLAVTAPTPQWQQRQRRRKETGERRHVSEGERAVRHVEELETRRKAIERKRRIFSSFKDRQLLSCSLLFSPRSPVSTAQTLSDWRREKTAPGGVELDEFGALALDDDVVERLRVELNDAVGHGKGGERKERKKTEGGCRAGHGATAG